MSILGTDLHGNVDRKREPLEIFYSFNTSVQILSKESSQRHSAWALHLN